MVISIAHPQRVNRDTWREVVFDHLRMRVFGITADPARALRAMLDDAATDGRWIDALVLADMLDWIEGNTPSTQTSNGVRKHDSEDDDREIRQRLRNRRMAHMTGAPKG